MTTVAVVLCACGHAERMHERDEFKGRGACHHRDCGCPEFGEEQAEVVQPDPAGGPALEPQENGAFDTAPEQVEAETAELGARPNFEVFKRPAWANQPAPVPDSHPCSDCDRSFATANGLRVHRGMTHRAEPDYEAVAQELDARRQDQGEPAMTTQVGQEQPASEEEMSFFPTSFFEERFSNDLIFPMLAHDEMLTQYFVLLICRAEQTGTLTEFLTICDRIERVTSYRGLGRFATQADGD